MSGFAIGQKVFAVKCVEYESTFTQPGDAGDETKTSAGLIKSGVKYVGGSYEISMTSSSPLATTCGSNTLDFPSCHNQIIPQRIWLA